MAEREFFTPENLQDLRFMDKIISDPSVTRVLNKTREFNVLLADIGPGVSDEDLNEMIQELDSDWGDRLHQTCYVTGKVHILGEPEPVRYKDKEVLFKGAGAIRHYKLFDDATEVSASIGLQVWIQRRNDKGAVLPTVVGTIPIDNLYNIEFDEPSPEHASYWLRSYYPDIIEDIDARIAEETRNESMACLRLGDMRVDLTHHIAEMNTPEQRPKTLKYMRVHTGSWFNFDKNVQYRMWLDNKYMYVPVANGLAVGQANSAGMMTADVDDVYWIDSIDTPGYEQAFLKIRKLEEDPKNDETAVPWFVPLDAVYFLDPWRPHMLKNKTL